MSANHLYKGDHSSRVGEDHAIPNAELLCAGREDTAGQDCVVGLGCELILTQLGDIVVAPRGAVLGVIHDASASAALLNDLMDDVRPLLPLLDALQIVM